MERATECLLEPVGHNEWKHGSYIRGRASECGMVRLTSPLATAGSVRSLRKLSGLGVYRQWSV